MHVVPAQTEQLGATGAGHSGNDQEGVQLRVPLGDVVEQRPQLIGCRRGRLSGGDDDPMRALGRVVPDPTPTH